MAKVLSGNTRVSEVVGVLYGDAEGLSLTIEDMHQVLLTVVEGVMRKVQIASLYLNLSKITNDFLLLIIVDKVIMSHC